LALVTLVNPLVKESHKAFCEISAIDRQLIMLGQSHADREIAPLRTMCLKMLAKDPTSFFNTTSLSRMMEMMQSDKVIYDMAQELVNYITEAGRFSDDILPPNFFEISQGIPRKTLSFANSKVSSAYICRVIDKCPMIEVVDMSGCLRADNTTFMYIVDNCKHLKSLSLRNCRKITDEFLEHILSQCASTTNQAPLSQLESLNMGGTINISSSVLNKFFNTFPRISYLTFLNISGQEVNDETLNTIKIKCSSLAQLGLGYADISESALRQCLTAIGPQLEILNLSWINTTTSCENQQLSVDFFVNFLPRVCPKVIDLDVSGLKNVSLITISQYLDAKTQSAEVEPTVFKSLGVLRARFISSTKASLEQQLSPVFPSLVLDI
jgi:hypothetical protein